MHLLLGMQEMMEHLADVELETLAMRAEAQGTEQSLLGVCCPL